MPKTITVNSSIVKNNVAIKLSPYFKTKLTVNVVAGLKLLSLCNNTDPTTEIAKGGEWNPKLLKSPLKKLMLSAPVSSIATGLWRPNLRVPC